MEIPLSLSEWILACGVVLLGALIQGSIGFGVALLGAPLLYLINPQLVPAPVIMIGMTLPMLILARDWHDVALADVGWILPGKLLGTVLAAILLGYLSDRWLGLIFGSLVLLGVLLSVMGRFPKAGHKQRFLGGSLAGFMATTTSIGGPPLALVLQHMHGARLRGTLSACFLPGGVMSLLALAWVGRLGPAEWLMGISLLPAMVLGFLLSFRLAHWLDRAWLRPALLAVSGLAGLAAIGNGIHQLFIAA